MKCPKCGYPRIKYNTKKQITKSREGKKISNKIDFKAKCKRCGWEGIING